MIETLLTVFGKSLSRMSKTLNVGSGETLPGHIALLVQKDFIKRLLKNSDTKVILIAGTNGKTTTGRMLTTILRQNGQKVFQNSSGANLVNGIASSVLLHTNFFGKVDADFAVFEVDENNLPLVLAEVTPSVIIITNLFRDQLDRYGELDAIAQKWKKTFQSLPQATSLVLNADDPLIAYLGVHPSSRVSYYGLDEHSDLTLPHAADSLYCPKCQHKLTFTTVYYSHLGDWYCTNCKLKRPNLNTSTAWYPLPGLYNKYNALAATLSAHTLGLTEEQIIKGLQAVTPAFGRQEKLVIGNKNVQLFLSKNPTSMNESLRTIHDLGAKKLCIILNDRIPDGTDVSWIWDIDWEEYINSFDTLFVGGDRAYDMQLRLFYADRKKKVYLSETLETLLRSALKSTKESETLFILPTYSAMLETRKVLTGKSIL